MFPSTGGAYDKIRDSLIQTIALVAVFQLVLCLAFMICGFFFTPPTPVFEWVQALTMIVAMYILVSGFRIVRLRAVRLRGYRRSVTARLRERTLLKRFTAICMVLFGAYMLFFLYFLNAPGALGLAFKDGLFVLVNTLYTFSALVVFIKMNMTLDKTKRADAEPLLPGNRGRKLADQSLVYDHEADFYLEKRKQPGIQVTDVLGLITVVILWLFLSVFQKDETKVSRKPVVSHPRSAAISH